MNTDTTERPIRVLLVYSVMLPSVEANQLIPLLRLASQKRLELKHGSIFDLSDGAALTWCDIVVFCRCYMSNELPFLLKVQALHIPYLYDLDDNFFRLVTENYPGTAPLRWSGTMETLRAFIADAAFVKVNSPQLLQDVSPYNARCVIHPYAFDFSILNGIQRHSKQDQRIRVGYAGTVGHTSDLTLAAGAIRRILEEYPERVLFTFYGPDMKEFRGFPNVRFVPFLDNYQAFLRDFYAEGWDIAIAPLHNTIWNLSKDNTKYREYAACRCVGVYSDMPVYNTCVTHGVNGMLCADTEDAWYEALTTLIENPALLVTIRENALQDVAEHYSLDAVAERMWKELIVPAFANGKPTESAARKRQLWRSVSERARRRAEVLRGDQSFGSRVISWEIVWFRMGMQFARHLAKRFLRRYSLGRYGRRRR